MQKNEHLIVGRFHLDDNACVQGEKQAGKSHRCVLSNSLIATLYYSPWLISFKNRDSEYIGCNQRILELNNLNSTKDIIGKHDNDMPWGVSADINAIRLEDQRILSKEVSFILYRYKVSEKEINLLIKKLPLFDENNHIIGVATCSTEIINFNLPNVIHTLKTASIVITPALIESIKDIFLAASRKLSLSIREEECLYFLLKGLTSKQIGKVLGLSYRTIESYLDNLKDKFACRKLSALIVKALELGYLDNIPVRILLRN